MRRQPLSVTPQDVCRFGYLAVVVGAGFILVGVLLIPAMPYFQLDVVLSPAELRDQDIRESTLAVLQAANGSQWLIWAATGIVLMAIGFLGWLTARRLDPQLSPGADSP